MTKNDYVLTKNDYVLTINDLIRLPDDWDMTGSNN